MSRLADVQGIGEVFQAASENEKPKPRKRASPLSLRVNAQERVRLEALAQAQGVSLGGLIRQRVFGYDGAFALRSRGKFPVRDHKALGEALARLGQSRLASNLNQLAKAVNLGALPLSPEVEADLRAACADILAIKALLLRALGQRA